MKKSWLKEIARDLLALGSIPFYFLVVIRSVIGNYLIFVYQMVIAAIAVFVLKFIVKNSDLHIAMAFVIMAFTGIFYKERIFTVFAALVWILMLLASYYLKRKIGPIIRGVIIGLMSFIAAYFLAPII